MKPSATVISDREGDITTNLENQVQATESKDKDEAVVEEEAVTKDVKDHVGASTSQHTSLYVIFNGIPMYGNL